MMLVIFSYVFLMWFTDATGRSPNVIVIMVDDLGIGDLGSYGSTVHQTPNIDR